MTGEEYRAALKAMRMTLNAFSRFLGVARRTGQMYAENGAPPHISTVIRMLESMSEKDREHWIAPHR